MTAFPGWTRLGTGVAPHRGVAPLGLEPVGRWFVDRLMPGINNITEHVRYYSFFSWALWTFLQQAQEGHLRRTNQDQARWLVRMENILRFATLYADWRDQSKTWGLIGVERAGKLDLPWADPDAMLDVGEKLAATAFVPAAYRASFAALGCAEIIGDHANLTAGTGGALAEAFHHQVLTAENADAERALLLSTADRIPMRVLHRLADAVRIRPVATTDPEQPLLADLLFRIRHPRQNPETRGTDENRARSIALLMDVLRAADAPLRTGDYHAVFASGHLPGGHPYSPPPGLQNAWVLWRGYQEREFQRVALYGFLHAAVLEIREQERQRGHRSSASVVGALVDAARAAAVVQDWLGRPISEWTVGEAQDALLDRLDPTGADFAHSLEGLSSRVIAAEDTGEIVAGSLLLFLLATATAERAAAGQPTWIRRLHERGDSQRLSLALAIEDVERRRPLPLPEFTRWLLETYVLAQTFGVAMQKLAEGRFRFFLAVGDDGYEVVRAPTDGRLYYPPRIASAFQMLSELGLLEPQPGGTVGLSAPGHDWLDETIRHFEGANTRSG
jgi:hypothetical protein